MLVRQEHRDFVEKNIEKLSTRMLREELERKYLTKTQANNCIKNVKKRLKIKPKKENVDV